MVPFHEERHRSLVRLGVDGRIILLCILKKWDGCVDWIDLAQDLDRWRVLVNAAVKLLVPQNARNFLNN